MEYIFDNFDSCVFLHMHSRVVLSTFDTSTNGIVAAVRRRYPHVSFDYTSNYCAYQNDEDLVPNKIKHEDLDKPFAHVPQYDTHTNTDNISARRRLPDDHRLCATFVSSDDVWDVRCAFYLTRMLTGANPVGVSSKRLELNIQIKAKSLKLAIMFTPLRKICLDVIDVFDCFIFFENMDSPGERFFTY